MPTLLQNLCVGQYQACLLVMTRLAANCTPQTGPNDQVRTSCFASVDAQPQYDDGAEYGRRGTDGKRCFYVRDCNHFKQIDLTFQIITWDMELIELATGSELLSGKTGSPFVNKSMGFGLPGGDSACPSGVAVEVYTKAAYGTGGFCVSAASGAPTWVRHLFPFTRLQMGQVTLDDSSDGILLNLTGFGMANPNWGNGPANDWPAENDVAVSSPYAAVFTNTKPDSTCGYTASLGAPPGAPAVFNDVTFWIDAYNDNSASMLVTNLGSGGAVLNAQYGSAAGVDPNHPKWLPSGAAAGAYVYFPATAGNYLSTPNTGPLQISGDLTLAADVTLSDWTPTIVGRPVGKEGSYDLHFGTDGTLGFVYADVPVRSAQSSVPTGIVDGSRYQVAVTKKGGISTNDVKFWTRANDAASWVQLGTTQSSGGVAISQTANPATVGGDVAGTQMLDGIVHQAWINNTVGGSFEPVLTTPVLYVNTSANVVSETATTFTATSGQTMTVNRSAAGRKTVVTNATGKARWLFGTDDYLIVADNALLDFSATESFTLLGVRRRWGSTTATNHQLVVKYSGTGSYYGLYTDPATSKIAAQLSDGTNTVSILSPAAPTDGLMLLQANVRDVGADLVRLYQGATELGNAPDTTTGTIANAGPFYIGFNGGTIYYDAEIITVALWRRVLSPAEITTIATFYGV